MIEIKINGLPELRKSLAALPDKLRYRALRNALSAGARIVLDAAKAAAPALSRLSVTRRRKSGTVRKAISVRTSKLARRRGNVGVFINVKPAKGGARGANKPTDPFYWRFLNWGWNPASAATGGRRGAKGKQQRRKMNKAGNPKVRTGWEFMEAGAAKLGAALEAFKKSIGPQIEKLNKP